MDAAACARRITGLFAERDPFVELEPARPVVLPGIAPERALGPQALERLNVLLPWTSFHTLGDGRVLGSAWSPTKRARSTPLPDKGVQKLNELVPLGGLSVLEAGCYEGHHTATLAHLGAEVWAFDARIENVLKTLVRLWVFGLERAAVVELIDLESGGLREHLVRRGRSDPFDLVHHRGVLYHLSRPVEHLADVATVCARHLYLHTQISRDDQANSAHRTALGEFPVFSYDEAERAHAPFAGMIEKAAWLTRQGLLSILSQLGFQDIQVLSEQDERNGPRIELLASRSPLPVEQNAS
jgi:tRNA (mo5U34)-methyltransferase